MELFTEGQKISIFFAKGQTLVEMVCTIETVYDDRLELALPQYFMRYIEYLQAGSDITAKAFSKIGTVDFNAVIISSPLEEDFLVELDYNSIKLTPSNEVPAINAIENIEVKSPSGTFKLKTFEISAEYVKFTSFDNFHIEDQLECIITLPDDYGIINFTAVISGIDPVYENEYTANIITMTENDRQNLLYYMYVYSNNLD